MLTPPPAASLPGPRPFRLLPHPASPAPPDLRLSGELSRHRQALRLTCRLEGDLQRLLLQDPVPYPQRSDGLWQSSCLECFLADPGARAYLELNLSPAGHWNAYHLCDYRSELTPVHPFEAPLLLRRRGERQLELEMSAGLPLALASVPLLQAGVSAVIASREGMLSYWALSHPGPQPDFHRREAFRLWI